MYNPRSMKATEFIDHQEILDTLAYADAHKDDLQLVDAILEKVKDCKGLSHREASVLLVCEDETRLQRMYDLAKEIKLRFYDNRIVSLHPCICPTTASMAVYTVPTTQKTSTSAGKS